VAAHTPAALDRAGDAGQAVVVTAEDYGSTTATLATWQRAGAGWEQVHGPWPAYVGYAGFAPPGEKREGDGRTPSGTFGFEFAFGVEPDPGVALPYRRVTGPSIVWDDVPSSPSYNQWVDGGVGEAMYQTPVYDYAAVIAYNTARTPGLGSAIFLHVSRGNPTAGCVSLPVERLLEVLRWLDPARAPVVVMGVA
jgi:L,D-peptidoglycan transpeptidase YkuD (ErfK/YbiS/YcfS/YnhG family)